MIQRALVVIVSASIAVALATGCNKKKSETSGAGSGSSGSAASGSAATGEPVTPTVTPTVAPTVARADAADAAFVIAGCKQAGYADTACACVGEAARGLGAPLLAKIQKAPPGDEPGEGYYTAAEIQNTMTWMSEAAATCGIGQVAP